MVYFLRSIHRLCEHQQRVERGSLIIIITHRHMEGKRSNGKLSILWMCYIYCMLSQLTFSATGMGRTCPLKVLFLNFLLSDFWLYTLIWLFFWLCHDFTFFLFRIPFSEKSDGELAVSMWTWLLPHWKRVRACAHRRLERRPEITGCSTAADQPANKQCFRWQPATLEAAATVTTGRLFKVHGVKCMH